MGSRRSEIYSLFIETLADNIYNFIDCLGVVPTFQQRQVFDAVQRGDLRVAVKSGQGPGKSLASAIIGMWRLLRAENHKILVVAPTMFQSKTVWLGQARKLIYGEGAHPSLRKIFKFSATSISMFDYKAEDWGALMFTASTSSEKAQGQHSEDMDVIFEEASGISKEIDEQYEGTASNPGALWLKIGNPNTRICPFFRCFNQDKDNWTHFTWNAEETPNSRWFNQSRNKGFEETYGRDSDFYRIRVLGEFPHADAKSILSLDDLDGCFDTHRLGELSAKAGRNGKLARQFGLDFARFGGDENTVYQRQGAAVRKWKFWPHTDPNEVVLEAFRWQKEAGWSDDKTLWVPDAGGIGQGVMYRFYENRKNVYEFHTQSNAVESTIYDNQMTEALFDLADKAKLKELLIPEDSILIEQLTNRAYDVTSKGLLIAESKTDYKRRTFLQSPDRAEGLAMAYYDGCSMSSGFIGG